MQKSDWKDIIINKNLKCWWVIKEISNNSNKLCTHIFVIDEIAVNINRIGLFSNLDREVNIFIENHKNYGNNRIYIWEYNKNNANKFVEIQQNNDNYMKIVLGTAQGYLNNNNYI